MLKTCALCRPVCYVVLFPYTASFPWVVCWCLPSFIYFTQIGIAQPSFFVLLSDLVVHVWNILLEKGKQNLIEAKSSDHYFNSCIRLCNLLSLEAVNCVCCMLNISQCWINVHNVLGINTCFALFLFFCVLCLNLCVYSLCDLICMGMRLQ